jgi:hypothetical protein
MLLPAPNTGLRSYVAAAARAQIEIKFLRFTEVEFLSSADILSLGALPWGLCARERGIPGATATRSLP